MGGRGRVWRGGRASPELTLVAAASADDLQVHVDAEKPGFGFDRAGPRPRALSEADRGAGAGRQASLHSRHHAADLDLTEARSHTKRQPVTPIGLEEVLVRDLILVEGQHIAHVRELVDQGDRLAPPGVLLVEDELRTDRKLMQLRRRSRCRQAEEPGHSKRGESHDNALRPHRPNLPLTAGRPDSTPRN